MTYEKILESLDAKNWHSLTEDEKIDFFQSLECYMAVENNRQTCTVNGKFLYTGEEGVVLGQYSPERGEIDINVSQFDEYSLYGKTPDRLVQTCLHEGRHALQHQVAEGLVEYPNKELAEEWKLNLEEGNYISYEDNPRGYYNQPVERDARSFAEQRYKELLEEKEQYSLEKNESAIIELDAASKIFDSQMESIEKNAANYVSNSVEIKNNHGM